MLNPFPIQFLSVLAFTMVRFFLGVVLVHLGLQTLRAPIGEPPFRIAWLNRRACIVTLGCGELVLGTLIMLGYMTQYAALGTIMLALFVLMCRTQKPVAPWPEPLSWKFIIITSLSLFITGAGIFAFDLPL